MLGGSKAAVYTQYGIAESMMRELFSRYDVDDSGTINTRDELRQLVTNVMFTSKLTGPRGDLTSMMMEKVNDAYENLGSADLAATRGGCPADLNMDFEAFAAWYERTLDVCMQIRLDAALVKCPELSHV